MYFYVFQDSVVNNELSPFHCKLLLFQRFVSSVMLVWVNYNPGFHVMSHLEDRSSIKIIVLQI